jgi:hypothetical protein
MHRVAKLRMREFFLTNYQGGHSWGFYPILGFIGQIWGYGVVALFLVFF